VFARFRDEDFVGVSTLRIIPTLSCESGSVTYSKTYTSAEATTLEWTVTSCASTIIASPVFLSGSDYSTTEITYPRSSVDTGIDNNIQIIQLSFDDSLGCGDKTFTLAATTTSSYTTTMLDRNVQQIYFDQRSNIISIKWEINDPGFSDGFSGMKLQFDLSVFLTMYYGFESNFPD
jgi:hypothetical protein